MGGSLAGPEAGLLQAGRGSPIKGMRKSDMKSSITNAVPTRRRQAKTELAAGGCVCLEIRLNSQDTRRARWNVKVHALCGIEAPILFTLMVLIEGFLVRGYSQVSQPISDLGAYSLYGSYAVLQNLNFWAFGVLVLTLAVGLGLALPRSEAVSSSLAIFGVLAFSAGVFPDQPYPYPGYVHSISSIVAFMLVIASQFFLWRRLRRATGEERAVWGRHGTYSLVSGILSFCLLLVFILGLPQSSPFYGAGQRVFVAVPWLWIGVTAFVLYKSESRAAQNS